VGRDDFTKATIETLAKRVAYHCSNPDCRRVTSGPHEDESKAVILGVAAHITAASEGGPRYDPSLSSQERKSPSNGIWLCEDCGTLIDKNPARYTLDLLRQWKAEAEALADGELVMHPVPPPPQRTGPIAWLIARLPEKQRESRLLELLMGAQKSMPAGTELNAPDDFLNRVERPLKLADESYLMARTKKGGEFKTYLMDAAFEVILALASCYPESARRQDGLTLLKAAFQAILDEFDLELEEPSIERGATEWNDLLVASQACDEVTLIRLKRTFVQRLRGKK
jgi:hypothetical protein